MNNKTSWKQRIVNILSQRERKDVSTEGRRRSAVLVPIYENDGEYYIILTKRSLDMEHHKGHMAFPGGSYEEADGDLKNTALREAFEEVGIRAEDVEILGKLDGEATSPTSSNSAITPFVGAIPFPYEFKVNEREVDALVEVPVSSLLDRANYSPTTMDTDGQVYTWGHFQYGEYKITGITARMLKQFLDLCFR